GRGLLPLPTARGAWVGRVAACGCGLCRRRHEGAHRPQPQQRRGQAPGAAEIAMPTLLFGVVVLVLVLWGLNAYSKADPKYLAKVMRPAGGILAMGAAVFLFFCGHPRGAVTHCL